MAISTERQGWTREAALTVLRIYIQDCSGAWTAEKSGFWRWLPNIREYAAWAEDRDAPTVQDVLVLFDDWRTALTEAGAETVVGLAALATASEVVEAIQEAAEELGDELTQASYTSWAKSKGRPGASSAIRYFLTWNNALATAELAPKRLKTLQGHEGEVLSIVAMVCQDNGMKPLTIRVFNELRPAGCPRGENIARLFGGWANVMRAVGFTEQQIEAAASLKGRVRNANRGLAMAAA